MAENSGIEWTDHTFNPWVGCTKVGPGCDGCYAEAWAKRAGAKAGVTWGGERRRTSASNWELPLKWNAQAAREGRRFRVFCASLADVFDNQVPPAWRAELFALIDKTPNLDWLLLTKRIGNVPAMLDRVSIDLALRETGAPWPPRPNVWLGATVVNQAEADRDIPKLLAVPASVRFLSIEPLLGPIDLTRIELHKGGIDLAADAPHEWRRVREVAVVMNALKGSKQLDMAPLSWVICGGESGPSARPMHPDWARRLRDQCAAAGVPFLFKQWGEFFPDPDDDRGVRPIGITSAGELLTNNAAFNAHAGDAELMFRVGKKAAGRLLDGRTHDEFPEVARA